MVIAMLYTQKVDKTPIKCMDLYGQFWTVWHHAFMHMFVPLPPQHMLSMQ